MGDLKDILEAGSISQKEAARLMKTPPAPPPDPRDIRPGDELASVKLLTPLSLPNLNETHVQASKHKVKLTAHQKGVLLTLPSGETWMLCDAGLQAYRKAEPKEPKPAEKQSK